VEDLAEKEVWEDSPMILLEYMAKATLVFGLLLPVPYFLMMFAKRAWVETVGRIVDVEIRTKKEIDEEKVRHYVLNYRFYVGTDCFDGKDSIALRVPYYKEVEEIEKLESEYQKGGNVVVYYNMRNPKFSALRREVPELPKVLMVSAAWIITSALALYILPLTVRK
jgi:hypothetical protein